MGNFLSNLFQQFSNYIMIGLALVIVALGLWLTAVKSENADLTEDLAAANQTIQNQKVEISGLNLKNALQQKSIDALEDRAKEKAEEAAALAQQLAEIDNVPDEEDGPVADVLCRVLTGTKCVRNDAEGSGGTK